MMGIQLSGRRVSLDPLRHEHMRRIHRIANAETVIDGWPLFGDAQSAQELEISLWRTSTLQFAIRTLDSGEVIGLVQGHDEEPIGKTVGLGLLVTEDLWRAGWPLEAAVIFIELAFFGLGYRKVYLTTSGSLQARLGGYLNRWIVLEGTQCEHLKRATGYEDVHILAVHRDTWSRELAALILGRYSGTYSDIFNK